MKKWANKQSGFTIVELLIVVVVIAILAAITIVAYNGIQNRAKASAAQSAVSQAAKKVMVHAVDNAEQYPATLAVIGVADNGSVSYQYSVDNTSNPRTYCVTATNSNVSYYQSSAVSKPTLGACSGHGVGGVPPITNLSIDPRATTYSSLLGTGKIGWTTARGAGTHSLVTGAVDGPLGISTYARKVMTATVNGNDGFSNSGIVSSVSSPGTGIPVVAGDVYFASAWVRHNSATTKRFQVKMWWLNENGDRLAVTEPGSADIPVNTWTRVTTTGTVPAGTTRLATLVEGAGGAATWAANEIFDATGLMIVKGAAQYTYADGASSGWVWNGPTNNSTSTGPNS